jgi:hypothetical protein
MNSIYIVYFRFPEVRDKCWVGSSFHTYEEAKACVDMQKKFDNDNNFGWTHYKIAEIPLNRMIFTNDHPQNVPVSLQ